MDVDAVPIEGHLEVVALHRFLFECKLEDISSVYAGSPFIAAIQHRLADALELADPGTGWNDWRKAEQHGHRVEAVRQYLAAAGPWWMQLGLEQRGAYVRDILAPLRVSTELLADLTAVGGEPLPTSSDRTANAADFE